VTVVGGLLAATALAGAGYCFVALHAAQRFAALRAPSPGEQPGVSVLKPLAGADPELYDNLRSFLEQDWPAVQLVCGVASPRDPAVAVVERLKRERPEQDIALVVDPRVHGGNRKVGNLVNMWPSARHDVVIIADSDMRVDRDYLAKVVPLLLEAGVGLVTCLYRGRPKPGLWSALGALHINAGFVPQVLVGHLTSAREGCYGATMALRRETLARIGGFAALADHLADDWLLGEKVRGLGLKVMLAPYLVDDIVGEPDLPHLFAHERRWARTIRLLAPLGQLGSIITHPLPLALLALATSGGGLAWLALALALTGRLALVYGAARAFGVPPAAFWLVPVRDLLSFAVWLSCWFGSTVAWRGERYRVGRDGRLTYEGVTESR
jgi:ceramide glucosyltransferase